MEGLRKEGIKEPGLPQRQAISRCGSSGTIPGIGSEWWGSDPADDAESGLVRLVHGVPDRRNRIEALGNAWVPQVAKTAWNHLTRGLK